MSQSEHKELTKAEEQVMQILWKLEGAFVKEILAEFPEPRPAYNTVSTIVRILASKGFVGHQAIGKSHRYHPLVTKETYAAAMADRLVKGYFGNSVERLLSFFVDQKQVSTKDLDEWLRHLEEPPK